jgi:hypothetical protein
MKEARPTKEAHAAFRRTLLPLARDPELRGGIRKAAAWSVLFFGIEVFALLSLSELGPLLPDRKDPDGPLDPLFLVRDERSRHLLLALREPLLLLPTPGDLRHELELRPGELPRLVRGRPLTASKVECACNKEGSTVSHG